MIAGLDSATPPTAAQVAAARAAGVGLWSGYLATLPGVGLRRPWTQAEFEVARQLPAPPIAFCSGWDDAAACRDLARAWGVRLCLDVENGIRGDGAWVDEWLRISGAGLYGNLGVHAGRAAAFHILSYYPGFDPGGVWSAALGPTPVGPLGWQWQGDHQEFGAEVDRGWYDDWFGGVLMDQATFNALMETYLATAAGTLPAGQTAIPPGQTTGAGALMAILPTTQQGFNLEAAVKAELDLLKAEIEAGHAVDAAAAIARIETALRSA